MFKIEDAPRELSFGRRGEHGEQYEFDFSAWAAELPGGGPGVTVILPYTSDVVTLGAAQAVVDGTTLTVKIDTNLTLTAGRGTMVIRYVVDGHEKRSRTIDFTVEESHAPASGPAPEPVTDWVSDATAKMGEVDHFIDETIAATTAANTATGLTNAAILGAQTATGLADSATLAANAAASLADTKAGLADSAATAANAAAGLAVEKAGLANEAAQAAEDAEIVAVEFSGDDIVFTKTSEETVVLTGGKSDLLLNFKGEWDDEAEDAFFDVVEYYGSSYVYTNPIPSTGNTPTNETYWQMLAQAGGQFVDTESLTWEGVQDVVIQGLGPTVFPIGTQLQTAHSAYITIVWNVVAHNYDLDPTGRKTYSMTLHMHHVIYGRQFDNIEALYACAAELPAGTYNFALPAGYDEAYGGGLTYQFTLSNAVPAGGVIMFPWGSNVQASTIQISSYPTQISTSAIESVAVTAGSDGTALGTADGLTANMNHAQRICYGSNNWNQSAVRQWLNSDAPANAWWTPQTIFDRPPTYADVAGFLNGLDPAFVAVLGETDHVTVNNTVTDGGGAAETRSYVTRDKIYLPSRIEICTHENALAPEGEQYPYYADTVDADKIKYDISSPATARYWWMRSPNVFIASTARGVNGATGVLYGGRASGGIAAAAACVIL